MQASHTATLWPVFILVHVLSHCGAVAGNKNLLRDDSLRARSRPQVLDRILRCRLVFGVTTRKTLTRTAPAFSRVQMNRPCLSVSKTSGRLSFAI